MPIVAGSSQFCLLLPSGGQCSFEMAQGRGAGGVGSEVGNPTRRCRLRVILDRSGYSCLLVDVRFGPKATTMLRCREVTQSANCGPHAPRQTTGLIDHLIGDRDQLVGNDQPERFGGFLVHDKLELYRLLNRNVTGLSPPEYLVHANCRPGPDIN
jgi:hypothetical protein